jgi:hypothetical protein
MLHRRKTPHNFPAMDLTESDHLLVLRVDGMILERILKKKGGSVLD